MNPSFQNNNAKEPINNETLTNESLSKRFKSTFDLVNYAIKRANDMIASGNASRGPNSDPELNIANAVLDQIEHETEGFMLRGGKEISELGGTSVGESLDTELEAKV